MQNPPVRMPAIFTPTGTLNFTDLDITDANHTPHADWPCCPERHDQCRADGPRDRPRWGLLSTLVTNTATAADGTIAWTFNGSGSAVRLSQRQARA